MTNTESCYIYFTNSTARKHVFIVKIADISRLLQYSQLAAYMQAYNVWFSATDEVGCVNMFRYTVIANMEDWILNLRYLQDNPQHLCTFVAKIRCHITSVKISDLKQ
jgi:hypothetical protein